MGSHAFFFFLMIFFSSFAILFNCSDWFMIWLSLEINMFSFLLIISKKLSGSMESCIKYFFIQSLGSSLLMLSFYSQSDFEENLNGVILSYKMGAGPFYYWFPAVCMSISWGSCFLLMSTQKLIPMLLISMYVSSIIWVVVLSSLVIGVLGIINQTNIKRLMAFSSIHHVGWMMVCNYVEIFTWVIYLLLYSFMILGVVGMFISNENFNMNTSMKVNESWVLVFGLLSMGGMPPMLGFFLKWWVFSYLVSLNIFVVVLMIILSAMTLYYYMRVIYSILYGENIVVSWAKSFPQSGIFNSFDSLYLLGTLSGPFIGLGLLIF